MTCRRTRNSGLASEAPPPSRRHGRRLGKAVFLLLCHLACGARAAHAQESQAETFFAEGRARLLARDYDKACPLFAESLRLDPASGAALNLALCQERQGKLASAWTSYQIALSLSQSEHKPAQERVARRRLDELDGRRSRVIVLVASASKLPGLVVEIDGAPVPESAWGAGQALDGGRHTLLARADGRANWTSEVVLADEQDSKTIEVPTLAIAPAAAEPRVPAVAGSAASLPPSTPPATAAPSSPAPATAAPLATAPLVGAGNRPSRWPALALDSGAAGVTVAALAVGVYYGVEARSRWNDRKRLCPEQQTVCGDAAAVSAGHDAERAASISTVAFGVGITGAALTGYLAWRFWPDWFPGKRTSRPMISATSQGASLSVETTF